MFRALLCPCAFPTSFHPPSKASNRHEFPKHFSKGNYSKNEENKKIQQPEIFSQFVNSRNLLLHFNCPTCSLM